MRLAALSAALLCCALAVSAYAQSPEYALEREEAARLQQAADALSDGRGVDAQALVERQLRGESALDINEAVQRIAGAAREGLLARRALFVRLIAIALLAALLCRFQEAFGEGAANAAQWICFLNAALLVAQESAGVFATVQRTVSGAAEGAQTLFPVLTTALAAVGGTGSAAALQPAVTFAVTAATVVCRRICLPLTAAFLTFSLLGCMTDGWPLSRMSALCRTLCSAALGVGLTAFTGLMTVRGFTAAVKDGLTLRAAKFAADTLIPEVGGALSDTAESALAGALLVKNALGVTGMVLIGLFFLTPLTEICLSALLFRAAAAVTEPFADARMTRCLEAAGGAMGMLAGCLTGVMAMFLVLAGQAVAAGGVIAMMS